MANEKRGITGLQWVVLVAVLGGLIWSLSNQQSIKEELRQLTEMGMRPPAPTPTPTPPPPVVTIKAGCTAQPNPLDPVHLGQTVWFNNETGSDLVVTAETGLFATTTVDVPAVPGALESVSQQAQYKGYWFYMTGPGCPLNPPPPEARPRIVIRSTASD